MTSRNSTGVWSPSWRRSVTIRRSCGTCSMPRNFHSRVHYFPDAQYPQVRRARHGEEPVTDNLFRRPDTMDDAIFREVVQGNEYRLPEKIRDDDIVVDIGAHIGSFCD